MSAPARKVAWSEPEAGELPEEPRRLRRRDARTELEWAADVAARLDLSADCLARAGEMVGNAARLDGLRREWLSDVVALGRGDRVQNAALRDPDGTFMPWLADRLERPFHVTFRSREAVKRRFGEAMAMRMTVRWPQEVAWADKLRSDPNDRVSVLAALALEHARREPAEAFERLAEICAGASGGDPVYARSRNHELAAAEILAGHGEPTFTPLCLRLADALFGAKLARMPAERLAEVAAKGRTDEASDRRRAAVEAFLARIRRQPPARLVSVIAAAVRSDVCADALLDLERRYVADVVAGRTDPATSAAHLELIGRIEAHGTDPDGPPVDAQEAARRRAAVEALDEDWLKDFPSDLQLHGAHRRRFEAWRGAIRSGARFPAADPMVDLAHFLMSEPDGD